MDSGGTDASGLLNFAGLAPGRYRLLETDTADGYVIDTTPVYFTVPASYEGEFPLIRLTFTNHAFTGNIHIVKTDDEDNPLSGAVFSLYDGGGNLLADHITTGGNGNASIAGLEPGSIVETSAPSGYDLDDTPHPVEVTYDASGVHNTVTLPLVNLPTTSSSSSTPASSSGPPASSSSASGTPASSSSSAASHIAASRSASSGGTGSPATGDTARPLAFLLFSAGLACAATALVLLQSKNRKKQ